MRARAEREEWQQRAREQAERDHEAEMAGFKARREKAESDRQEREKQRQHELTLARLRAGLGETSAVQHGVQVRTQAPVMQVQVAQGVVERRQWEDGGWYTLQDFENQLGPVQGQYMWQIAPRWQGM